MTRTLSVSGQPGGFPTIAAAVAAATGDTVILVAPGEYREALLISVNPVTIVAGDGQGNVVIDASGLGRPAIDVRGATARLRNVTLRSDMTPAVSAAGGTIRLDRCTLTARRATAVTARSRARVELSRCVVDGADCGLALDDSTGTVTECQILNIVGDGIIVRAYADPVVRDTLVADCAGRGVYVYQHGRPRLEGCEVCRTGAEGIAVAHLAAADIHRSWLHDCNGHGVSFGPRCGGSVRECRIENTAEPGIHLAPEASPEVTSARTAARVGVGTGGSTNGQQVETLDALLAELDGLVGLASVKSEVRGLIDEIQVNEWRRDAGMSVTASSQHLIFAGASGTGKTTVARIYGRLLSALGVLPKASFTEVSRRDLVGQYLGHTAERTASVFESALGGVLFIDEAYTLSRSFGSGSDFGQESIDTLVKMMEDHRDTIAVIAAGYSDEMKMFSDANPGLASRFAKTVVFEDYADEELILIVSRIAHAAEYVCDDAALAAVGQHFAGLERDRNFGNAREARRLFEQMRQAQARRLRALGRRPGHDDLRLLVAEDVALATAS